MSEIKVIVNGKPVRREVEPRTHLGDFLRADLLLTGTHLGCEHGVCGACTVLLDGMPVRSCITFAVACDGSEVRSIEGFEDDVVMRQLRAAFSQEHGLQCGFCTPGMLITSRDIVLRRPDADETLIREELAGNLCRCTGYQGIVNAVRSVILARAASNETPEPRPTGMPEPDGQKTSFETFSVEKAAPSVAEAGPAPREAGAGAPPNWTRLELSFDVDRPPDVVWELFSDFARVASCLPGAELTSHDENKVQGRLTVKFGPMAASFAGSAVVERDDATLTGTMKGGGADRGSGSRTKGQVVYSLEPTQDGKGTRVRLVTDYNLQGPLAQFSRSGLAQEFGRQLVAEFARNLNDSLSGRASSRPSSSLSAGRLIWATMRAVFANWFGRSGGGR